MSEQRQERRVLFCYVTSGAVLYQPSGGGQRTVYDVCQICVSAGEKAASGWHGCKQPLYQTRICGVPEDGGVYPGDDTAENRELPGVFSVI